MSGVAARLRAGWSPARIADLSLWLDANRITGLADGAGVATWSDASGNGRDATQGTAGTRPVYKTGIVNGLPIVRFDNVDDYMSSSLTAAPANRTILVVASKAAYSANAMIIGASGGGGLEFRITAAATLELVKEFTAVLGTSTGTLTGGTFQVQEITYVQAGAFNFYINGTAAGSGSSALTLTATTTLIGGLGGADQFNGDIAEIVVYDRVLTATERLQAERYLGAKYGVTVA